jgi:predicted dehydrogenase
MRFALLGDHPDGLDLARALVETGRHELAVYSGPAAGAEYLARWAASCQSVRDLEEVLADPAIEAVIVAGSPPQRPQQLRRAMQSERHVLCVQPVDTTPDTAYEAAMIQGDTHQVLLPILPESFHPGVRRLAELVRSQASGVREIRSGPAEKAGDNLKEQFTASRPYAVAVRPPSALGEFRLVEMERWSPELVLVEAGGRKPKASLPGWEVLRAIGGEVAEVFAFAAREELDPGEPLLLSGRFEEGGLFQATFLSGQHEARWRLSVIGSQGQADLVFPQGWPGPARLTWQDELGEPREESWDTWNPWPALVEVFENAVAGQKPLLPTGDSVRSEQGIIEPRRTGGHTARLAWQDAVRQLELDDAARQSVAKRRATALEYQEATEEAGFKGTMTLFGCGLLWGSLVLLILSRWLPWLGWLIAPLFGVFLLLQVLRWVVRKPGRGEY